MIKFNKLWDGEFMHIVSPEKYPYEIAYEKDCVMVLPIISTGGKNYVVIRKEFCPPYFIKDEKEGLYYTIISGGVHSDESSDAAMLRELEEESGLKVSQYETLFKKENIPLCKSTSIRTTFYIIKINETARTNKSSNRIHEERTASCSIFNSRIFNWRRGKNLQVDRYSGRSKLI